MTYDLPDVHPGRGRRPVRIVRLNRPEQLNATNHELHGGLADLFPQLDADLDARVAVITGNGRAFSAGGDFDYIDELIDDDALREETLVDGREHRHRHGGLPRARRSPPSTARPSASAAASWPCPTSCSWPRAPTSPTPHVLVGLVAADGGPVTWPLLTSLQLAKEYALTGDRIPAERAAEIGLVNHVCPDDEVLDQALACARKIATLPQRADRGHQAHPQPAPRAGRAGHPRLRPHRRGPLVPLPRARAPTSTASASPRDSDRWRPTVVTGVGRAAWAEPASSALRGARRRASSPSTCSAPDIDGTVGIGVRRLRPRRGGRARPSGCASSGRSERWRTRPASRRRWRDARRVFEVDLVGTQLLLDAVEALVRARARRRCASRRRRPTRSRRSSRPTTRRCSTTRRRRDFLDRAVDAWATDSGFAYALAKRRRHPCRRSRRRCAGARAAAA